MIAWWLFHFWKKTQMNQILLCFQPDKYPKSHKLLLALPWVSVSMRNRKRIAYKRNVLQGEFSSVFSWFSYGLQASGIIYVAVTHTEVIGRWNFQSNLRKIRLRCSSIGPRCRHHILCWQLLWRAQDRWELSWRILWAWPWNRDLRQWQKLVFRLTIPGLPSFIHAIPYVMASKSGDWSSWEPVLQKNSRVGGLCFSWVGIICLHHHPCGHKAGVVLPQEWAGQGLLLLQTLLPVISRLRGCGICCGKRIIRGFEGCLAGKSHRYPLSSLGDCPFHAKTVGCCLWVLQVAFAGVAISKIAV